METFLDLPVGSYCTNSSTKWGKFCKNTCKELPVVGTNLSLNLRVYECRSATSPYLFHHGYICDLVYKNHPRRTYPTNRILLVELLCRNIGACLQCMVIQDCVGRMIIMMVFGGFIEQLYMYIYLHDQRWWIDIGFSSIRIMGKEFFLA
jgi:hypothetical protein